MRGLKLRLGGGLVVECDKVWVMTVGEITEVGWKIYLEGSEETDYTDTEIFRNDHWSGCAET